MIRKVINKLLNLPIRVIYRHPGFQSRLKDQIRDAMASNNGERQAVPTLDQIRPDHLARYKLAEKYIQDGDLVGDFACGVGYGSFYIAQNKSAHFHAHDISAPAIKYARTYYANEKIQYKQQDLSDLSFPDASFSTIVSFETIEHIEKPLPILKAFHAMLKEGGFLLCSTPNEETNPLAEMHNEHHFQHYTPKEFESLLSKAGFEIIEKLSQSDRLSEGMDKEWNGLYNIAVCRKSGPAKSVL